jgi:amino-acid N-acetyltransferase
VLRTPGQRGCFTMLCIERAAELTLRAAGAGDAAGIQSLLERNALPTADLQTARAEFVVAYDGSNLVGVGALQRFGTCALLRSVAIESPWRSAGLGTRIVQYLEDRAREQTITEIVLLTQTATPFFQRQGYQVIERAKAPVAAQQSDEFRTLCPASADCMVKQLGTAGASA